MKYKLFSKRGLALIVSLMMCLSAMSTTAWAGSFTQIGRASCRERVLRLV